MNKTKAAHALQDAFPVVAGNLTIGGIPLDKLAQRVGQTPFYAYDRQRITDRVNFLRAQLPSELKLHYAIKANPMPAVVQHFAGLVDGFDLASGGEMHVALDTIMPAEYISFAGPGKSHTELRRAIAAGVTINLESERELESAAVISEELGYTAKVAVRVNPDFELKASGMKMGGGPKQFGIDTERLPAVLSRIKALNLEFVGFHIFSGSQNLKPEAIIEAHQKTFDLAYRLAENAPSAVRKLNIGGGFGIPYFPGEDHLKLDAIADNLDKLLPEAKRKLPEANVIIELGRYLIGEAGIYVCQVIDKKISRGHTFLVTNGGLHHHLAASGNFGQVIRKNYPVAIGNKMDSSEKEDVSVVGPLCTPLDLLGDKMELPKAEVGDLVVVFQSGAYGLTASPQNFLSHPHAIEVLV